MPISRSRPRLEFALVAGVSLALACAMTFPLVARLGSGGRVDTADGRFSIWNVAWVARTLVVDPVHLFDANIFYPNRGTLAYSENNIGAGVLALPAYWISGGNAFAAHNAAVLLAFALSSIGMYYLVRRLAGDQRAAAVSAVLFSYTPHVLGHTAHIQLLMSAGLPFSMLAWHRLVERPSTWRGVQLGAVMAATAISCGYYGIFAVLIVGFAVVVVILRHSADWRALLKAVAVAAVAAVVIVAPLFRPYAELKDGLGFGRALEEAGRYSADWRAYLASSSYAHTWILPHLGHWQEVLFPGFVATSLGLAGVWLARERRMREPLVIYGGVTLLALWASFGPAAGLYSVLYYVLPVFSFLRAPARFGLVVAFGLSVFAGIGLSVVLPKNLKGTVMAVAILVLSIGDLALPFPFEAAPALSPAYRILAMLPRHPVIEMPFYYVRGDYPRHTIYMLFSTAHWMPLVNGYSDHFPRDFMEHVQTLKFFPARDAFRLLEADGVRYAVFHLSRYNASNRADVLARLKEYQDYLRPLYSDDETRLYEIVGFPP